MSEQNNIKTNDIRTLNFEPSVIEDIASRAVLAVDGVLAMKSSAFDKAQQLVDSQGAEHSNTKTEGVKAEVGDIEVVVDLDIIVELGKNIPIINGQIIKAVQEEVAHDTGLKVVEVNVNVADILKKEEYQRVHLKQPS